MYSAIADLDKWAGAAFVTIVNETSSFASEPNVGLAAFPDLDGIMSH